MEMPAVVVQMVVDALGMHRKSLRGSRVLVLGAAYKRDIADYRESPSLKILEILERRGAEIAYNDPHVPSLRIGGHTLESVSLSALSSYDCVVIATDHTSYDYAQIVEQSPLLVDTRNATGVRDREHVFVL